MESQVFSIYLKEHITIPELVRLELERVRKKRAKREIHLKVHKTEIFFGFDFEIYIISLLVM